MVIDAQAESKFNLVLFSSNPCPSPDNLYLRYPFCTCTARQTFKERKTSARSACITWKAARISKCFFTAATSETKAHYREEHSSYYNNNNVIFVLNKG